MWRICQVVNRRRYKVVTIGRNTVGGNALECAGTPQILLISTLHFDLGAFLGRLRASPLFAISPRTTTARTTGQTEHTTGSTGSNPLGLRSRTASPQGEPEPDQRTNLYHIRIAPSFPLASLAGGALRRFAASGPRLKSCVNKSNYASRDGAQTSTPTGSAVTIRPIFARHPPPIPRARSGGLARGEWVWVGLFRPQEH